MVQRVKIPTRWGSPLLSASMAGSGVASLAASQEVFGAGSLSVAIVPSFSGAGAAYVPSEGDLVHGQLFTITGSGFGTKPAQTPHFHWNGVGTTSWSESQADVSGFADSGFRSVATPASRIPRYWYGAKTTGSYPWNVFIERTFPCAAYPTTVYASYYVRFDPNWSDSVGDRQAKPWTHQHTGSGYGGDSSYIGHEGINNGTAATWSGGYRPEGKYSTSSPWGEAAANACQEWVRREFLLTVGTQPDGSFRCWETTTRGTLNARLMLERTGLGTTFGTSPPGTSRIMFMGYVRDFGTNNYIYMTDVFLDIGANRVILTDNASFLGSKYHEPQPYTAWSDTSIAITANCGGLPNGSTGYLHVFGPSGTAAISPIEVTIGG